MIGKLIRDILGHDPGLEVEELPGSSSAYFIRDQDNGRSITLTKNEIDAIKKATDQP